MTQSSPSVNYGSATKLVIQGTEAARSYLRFDPEGLPGDVTSATLRLRTRSSSSHGFDVRAVADNSWGERSITYANAPAPSATVTGSVTSFASGQWLAIDVTALVRGNGPVSFALTRTRTTSISVASKEAGTASSPQLEVVANGALPPSNASTPTITGPPVAGGTLTAQPGAWTGTDPITYAYGWQRCDATGAACTPVDGATASSLQLGAGDVGFTLRVTVTASNAAGSSTATSAPTVVVLAAGVDPIVDAAGDIACDPASTDFNLGLGTVTACHEAFTGQLVAGANAVLALGDNQYECGALSAFLSSYDATWGPVKSLTHPVPGNHEYETSGTTDCTAANAGAAGYFDYFGPAAGERGKGYYSFDIGAWHLVALNSNCVNIGGCGAGSPEEQWLRQDLAASTAQCTLAYWHHPLFTSGQQRPGEGAVRPLFQDLYDAHADLVLNGHDHNYERFAPQDPSGNLDLARGIREIVAGTGGKSLYRQTTALPNSEVRNATGFGVLELALHPGSYDWRFKPDAGGTFSDSGSQPCDAPPVDTTSPSAPANLTASAASSTQVDLSWGEASDNLGVVGYDIYRDGVLLAKTASAVTGWSDTTVSASTAYRYEVRARDAAGNVSLPSNSATVAGTPPASVVSFTAVADARVEEAHPTVNYATSYLRTDGGTDPDVETYARFTVSNVSGVVKSAKLRLYVTTDGTSDGPAVYGTDGTWTESGLTWSNRPAHTSAAVDDRGPIATNAWVEYDVTPLVTGNGTYSFTLATVSTDGVNFNSRESSSGQPQLVVTTG